MMVESYLKENDTPFKFNLSENPSVGSFPKLFKELIKCHLQTSSRVDADVNKTIKYLKTHLYSIMFSHKEDEVLPVPLSDLEKLVWHSYILRKKRKFDDANKLDRHLKYFSDKGLLNDDTSLRLVFRFFTSLIDNETRDFSNQLAIPAPWVISKKGENSSLPSEPLCYNDTRLDCAFSRWHYTHFPSHLFKLEESVLNTSNKTLAWNMEKLSACDKEPGTDHRFNFLTKDEHEISKSCFGALSGPRKLRSPLTPDAALSIPTLPSVPQGYSFIHSLELKKSHDQNSLTLDNCASHKNEITTVDEGYVSSQCSVSGRSRSKKDDDIWEQVLVGKESLSKRHSWESLLKSNAPQEKPFISEAGAQVTRRLWSIEQHYISTIDPSVKLRHCIEMPLDEMCMQVLHLLIGIPSSSFPLMKDKRTFGIKEGLFYKGVTPGSIRPHLEELVECGNKILRLEEFCCMPLTEKSEHPAADTLALRSFKMAMKAFLFSYRQKILLLKDETKFLSLKLKSEPLRKKVHYVHRICSNGIEKKWFSNSLNLIGELKKELVVTRSASNLYLLFSFINAACKPFLVFLEKWIYEGELYDPGSEFMIRTDPDALLSRSRLYWTNGHSLCHGFLDFVPGFLREVLIGAYLCGKSMNLLRVCCPQSFLFAKREEKHPGISLYSSLNEVHIVKLQCQKYALEMGSLFSSFQVTLKGFEEEQKKREKLLIGISSRREFEFLCRFEEEKDLEMLRKSEKKRQALKDLIKGLTMSKIWKDRRKEGEEREEEKTLMEQKKKEQERDDEEQQQRVASMSRYKEEMGKLESREATAQSKLKETRHDLNLDLKLETFESKDSKNNCFKEAVESGREIPETDNESVSQMSTTSDYLETPNEDVITDIIPDEVTFMNAPRGTGNEGGAIKLSNNTNQREPNNNYEIIEDNSNEVRITRSEETTQTGLGNSFTDKLNHNSNQYGIEHNIFRAETPFQTNYNHSLYKNETKKQTVVAYEKIEDFKMGRLQSQYKSNNINSLSVNVPERKVMVNNPRVLQSDESCKCLKADFGEPNSSRETVEALSGFEDEATDERWKETDDSRKEITNNSREEAPENQNKEPNESRKDLKNRNEMDQKVVSDPVDERFRMRKSKSESSSLKDSDAIRSGKKKIPQRMSLFNLHENDIPVLIDKWLAGERIKSVKEEPSADSDCQEATSFDRELLESLAAVTAPSLSPYSQKLYDGRIGGKSVTDVTLSFLHKMNRSPTKENANEARAVPMPNQLSFSPVYLERGLSEHLKVQSQLVNCALLSHFLLERNLLQHFEALKGFLLFHDATFAHTLTQNLLRKFPPGRPSPSFTSPVELNGILIEAVAVSSFSKSSFTSNLSFFVANTLPNSPFHPLESIELRYRVNWPLCIILDEKVFAVYATLSKFLARLRQIMWTIEDVFRYMASMRLNSLQDKERLQFHQVSIFRNEVQQFVRVLLGYISHEAIEDSWSTLQEDIREKVSTLDDLYDCHWRFINDVREKCFLTSNTGPVQSLIQELFAEVILFQNLLKNYLWRFNSSTVQLENTGFDAIEMLMKRFRKISHALNKTLQKLLRCTQSSHIEHLVAQINFNDSFQQGT